MSPGIYIATAGDHRKALYAFSEQDAIGRYEAEHPGAADVAARLETADERKVRCPPMVMRPPPFSVPFLPHSNE